MAVLRQRWRWKRISPRTAGLLEHLARHPTTGADEAAGWRWIAAVAAGTRRRADQRTAHLIATFRALSPPPPEGSPSMELLTQPDPNLDRLRRLLRAEPTGGQLRALSDYERELGTESVATELDGLLAAGVPPDRSPYGAVRERLIHACQERRAGQRREDRVFGPAGRPQEHDDAQYEAKVRRGDRAQEVSHG